MLEIIRYVACFVALGFCFAGMLKQRRIDMPSVIIGLVTLVVIFS